MFLLNKDIILLIIGWFQLSSSNAPNEYKSIHEDRNDFDVLIFSQRWPITACIEWEEKDHSRNCTLPSNKAFWTVHGIWPTRNESKHLGPFYCNKSMHFDPQVLTPILPKLENLWTNIEDGTPFYSFWKHEWEKHGTCAASAISDLNTQLKYFNKGLDWLRKYEMGPVLAASSIFPRESEGYKIRDVNDIIKQSLDGKNPMIECVVENTTKKSYISEIRLCFDKQLELIDCATMHIPVGMTQQIEDDRILTNCNLNKTVMYTSIPPISITHLDSDSHQRYDSIDMESHGDSNKFDDNINFDNGWVYAVQDRDFYENRRYVANLAKLYNTFQFLIWLTM